MFEVMLIASGAVEDVRCMVIKGMRVISSTCCVIWSPRWRGTRARTAVPNGRLWWLRTTGSATMTGRVMIPLNTLIDDRIPWLSINVLRYGIRDS